MLLGMFKKILTWILYVLAIVPLIVAKGYFFPYISGKNLLIRWVITVFAVLLAGYAWYEKSFRLELATKTKALFKNPVGLFAGLFLLVNVISSFFATSSYRAFFGDIERGEGLLGLLFFFFVFVGMGLLFEHRDWIRFFKISLGVAVIMFFDALIDFMHGVVRPASFTGNPIYLAEVFLFALFAAGVVFWDHYKNSKREHVKTGLDLFWLISTPIIAALSLWGIFITETRGVILGIGASVGVVLLYAWWAGKHKKIGSRSVSKIAAWLLLILVVCGGLFFATKNISLWQHIPGLDRLTHATFTDDSTQTRLISAGVSLQAVSPSLNGWQKFLVGWGPENFNIAYNTYYNPKYFEYENKWFDRAHDKIFDVLVMNGAIGLVVYLGIWISLLWLVVRKREFSFTKLAILFFGVAYFVQNLTVFDSIVTYILWFAFLAYVIHEVSGDKWFVSSERNQDKQKVLPNTPTTNHYTLTAVFSITALFFAYALIFWTIVPFSQMSSYLDLIRSRASISVTQLETLLDPALHPYTYAQDVIRTSFLDNVRDLYQETKREDEKQLTLFAADQVHDLLVREPNSPRYWADLGNGYDALGKAGLTEYFPLAQEAFQQAQLHAPRRQDLYYARAYNLAFQKKYDESISVMQQAVALDDKVALSHLYLGLVYVSSGLPNYDLGFEELQRSMELNPGLYQQNQGTIAAYYTLLQHYYNKHDARAKDCALALEYMVPEKKDGLDMIIKNIDSGVWQHIQFK